MTRNIRIVTSLLLAWLALLAQPALAEPPPLDAYGDLPGFEDAAISPSGQRVAIVGTVGGKRMLLFLDSTMKLLNQATLEDLKLRGVEWVGEDMVLLTYSETQALSKVDFTSDHYEAVKVMIVPVDPAKKIEMVFGADRTIVTSIFGRYGVRAVDGKWKGYFGGIRLIGNGSHRQLDTTAQTLFEVGLPDNEAKKIAYPAEDGFTRDWLLDERGKIAAMFEMNDLTGNWRIENGNGKSIAKGTNPAGEAGMVALGKDGSTLIYSAQDRDDLQRTRIYELPLAGGEPAEVFEDIDVDGLFVEPSNGRVIGYAQNDKRVFFDPAIQALSDKIDRAFRDLHVTLEGWTPDFGHALVKTSGNRDSGTWYLVDLKELKAALIGRERPLIPPDAVGGISSFEYNAADGLEMDGVLTLPPGREAKNLPVVVLPHGGPSSEDEVQFDWWAQAFASRGYAVFQPNFRGSTNRGQAFHRAGYGEWGRKMQTDISDGLAALAAAGTVDPKRACIVGASYGGYAALAGVTLQNGLYRCAVADAPVSDVGLMYDTDYRESGSGKVVRMSLMKQLGPRATLEEVSPRNFAKKADAPILLIHGRDDTVVPFEQSTKMIDALKDAGKPYEFVEMKEEDHWLSRAVTRKQMLAAAVAFVQKHNPAD